MSDKKPSIIDRINNIVDAAGDWQEEMLKKAARRLALPGAAVAAAIVAGFGGAGGVATGMAAAAAVSGPAVAAIGLVAIGAVSVMTAFGGAAIVRKLVMAANGGGRESRRAGAIAALGLTAATIGAGTAGFVANGGFHHAQQNGDYLMPVNPELRRAFEAGIDRDRVRQVRKDIAGYAEKRILREIAEDFRLCTANRDRFAEKGIDCAVFEVPPASSPAP